MSILGTVTVGNDKVTVIGVDLVGWLPHRVLNKNIVEVSNMLGLSGWAFEKQDGSTFTFRLSRIIVNHVERDLSVGYPVKDQMDKRTEES